MAMRPVEDDTPKPLPWLRFADWSMPNPDCPATIEVMHAARYHMTSLTQGDIYRILALAEAYRHLAGHPTSTRNVVAQLRLVRREVKRLRRAP